MGSGRKDSSPAQGEAERRRRPTASSTDDNAKTIALYTRVRRRLPTSAREPRRDALRRGPSPPRSPRWTSGTRGSRASTLRSGKAHADARTRRRWASTSSSARSTSTPGSPQRHPRTSRRSSSSSPGATPTSPTCRTTRSTMAFGRTVRLSGTRAARSSTSASCGAARRRSCRSLWRSRVSAGSSASTRRRASSGEELTSPGVPSAFPAEAGRLVRLVGKRTLFVSHQLPSSPLRGVSPRCGVLHGLPGNLSELHGSCVKRRLLSEVPVNPLAPSATLLSCASSASSSRRDA